MTAIKNLLKRCIPWTVRRHRYLIRHACNHLRYQFGPAPLNDFSDYDHYWAQRGEKVDAEGPLRRWVIAAECIAEHSSLLDFGCGTGEFLTYIRSVKPTVKAKGLDISPRSVEMTRAGGIEADVINIMSQEIQGQYDYVTCLDVLEHIPEAEIAFRRLKQACRKQLIVSVPNIGYVWCRIRLAILGRFPLTNCQLHVKEHFRHWTPKDFREWVEKQGLKVVRIEGQYAMPYMPYKKWPSLFASGVVYVLERA